MKYAKKQLVYFIIHTSVGLAALMYGLIAKVSGNFGEGIIWGIVGGFLVTGILGILATLRLMKNPEKAKEVEIAKNEERSQLIRLKTHAALYYVTLYIICGATFAFGMLGYKEVSITLAGLLIVQLVLYYTFLAHYAKKY